MFWSSGGLKSKLAKAADAGPSGQMRNEKLHAIVARSRSQHGQTLHARSTFGSWDVQKLHAAVARRRFPSQSAKTQRVWKTFENSDGEKEHIIVARSTSPSQNVKTHQLRRSWDVEKVPCVVARNPFPSQNVQNASAPEHFWQLRCNCTPV